MLENPVKKETSIVVYGPRRCGKTTLANMIKKSLPEAKVVEHEPDTDGILDANRTGLIASGFVSIEGPKEVCIGPSVLFTADEKNWELVRETICKLMSREHFDSCEQTLRLINSKFETAAKIGEEEYPGSEFAKGLRTRVEDLKNVVNLEMAKLVRPKVDSINYCSTSN